MASELKFDPLAVREAMRRERVLRTVEVCQRVMPNLITRDCRKISMTGKIPMRKMTIK